MSASSSVIPGPEIAVVIPTFNEAKNAPLLIQRIEQALLDVNFEIIFVDDSSPDGTADVVRELAAKDSRVRCLQRIGRRGLSTAVIEGILATTAPVAAVIDGDMQHDETILHEMLLTLRNHDADVVVGSRYVGSGSVGDWGANRVRMSKFATSLSRWISGGQHVSDPMSGFFMVRTSQFRERAAALSGTGFKILLDYIATPGEALSIKEVPYTFRNREFGDSKLDNRVLLEFLELIISKSIGKYVPTKFIMFGFVGALGVVVHLIALSVLFKWAGASFLNAQFVASFVAMTTNFFINNIFTYHDRTLRGWSMLKGWCSFALVSSVGLMANVGVAVYLFESMDAIWYASAVAGIVVGAAWNFAASSIYTWK